MQTESIARLQSKLLSHTPPKPPVRTLSRIGLLLLGVIWPAVALLIELSTGVCASLFFDPIPTPLHAVAACLVPLANLACYLWLRLGPGTLDKPFAVLNGVALGVSAYYSLIFLPLTPIGLLASVLVIGLPMLAPYAGLFAGVQARHDIARLDLRPRRWAIAAAFVLLSLTEARTLWTAEAVDRAAEADPAGKTQWLRLLRAAGDDDYLLRLVHNRSNLRDSLFGSVLRHRQICTGTCAAEIWYRVKGEEAPQLRTDRSTTWDARVASTSIGRVLPGLALSTSQLEGWVDPAAGVSYAEWTMIFENRSAVNHEARAEVLLPPGAVVSRVTLWVNDEAKEAAFATKSKARAAYSRVVSVRRDPLLVTSAGPDRVLVQCFPVVPGTPMRIRLGITAPLVAFEGEGHWRTPRLVAANFETEKTPNVLTLRQPDGSVTQRAGMGVSGLPLRFPLSLNEAGPVRWRREPLGQAGPWLAVVDGSAAMKPHWPEIERVLAARKDVTIVYAGDAPSVGSRPADLFEGGKDNAAALEQALRLAGNKDIARIVWIHAPQGVELGRNIEALRWSLRRAAVERLYSFEVSDGADAMLKRLDGVATLARAPRFGTVAEDLERLLSSRQMATLEVTEPSEDPSDAGKALNALWAFGETRRLLALHTDQGDAQAARLSAESRIVTPASGAVVLERKEQYEAAGLRDPNASTGSETPEPGTIFLCAAGLAGLYWIRRRAKAGFPASASPAA